MQQVWYIACALSERNNLNYFLCVYFNLISIFQNYRNKSTRKSFLSPIAEWSSSLYLISLYSNLAFKILHQFKTFFTNKAVTCYNHKRNIFSPNYFSSSLFFQFVITLWNQFISWLLMCKKQDKNKNSVVVYWIFWCKSLSALSS